MTKDEPVTIVDRDVLKVISTDTRMNILKELGEGARTPSFLGKKFRKSNATIVEHLRTMERHGLVKKVEQPGKKFVFYTLTGKGQGIISSKSRKLVIILSVSLLLMFGGVFSLANYFYGLYTLQTAQIGGAAEKTLGRPIDAIPEFSDVVRRPEPEFPLSLYLGVALVASAMLGIILYIHNKSKFTNNEEMFL